MSIFIFGRLVLDGGQREFIKRVADYRLDVRKHIVPKLLDPEDGETLAGYMSTKQQGADFTICDGSGDLDATHLWIDAMKTARKAALDYVPDPTLVRYEKLCDISFPSSYFDATRRTMLWETIEAVYGMATARGCAVALVDGAIDEVKTDTREQVSEAIMKTMLLNWDCLPNCLYCWLLDDSK